MKNVTEPPAHSWTVQSPTRVQRHEIKNAKITLQQCFFNLLVLNVHKGTSTVTLQLWRTVIFCSNCLKCIAEKDCRGKN